MMYDSYGKSKILLLLLSLFTFVVVVQENSTKTTNLTALSVEEAWNKRGLAEEQ